jgi:hypothetical protein
MGKPSWPRVPASSQLASQVNRRWRQRMAVFFEASGDLELGEEYVKLHEVFFMPGRDNHHSYETDLEV